MMYSPPERRPQRDSRLDVADELEALVDALAPFYVDISSKREVLDLVRNQAGLSLSAEACELVNEIISRVESKQQASGKCALLEIETALRMKTSWLRASVRRAL